QPERDDGGLGAVMPRFTLTDADGAFRFVNVEAGEVELSARERVSFSSMASWWEPFAMTPEAEAEVVVEAGREAHVLLVVGSAYADVPTGRVEGTLWVNGRPGAGWRVRTWGRIRRSVSTDPDGRFDMGL